ncbi:uncharacterized protein LOC132062427 [Lycium ferocissimum]|uniref:uncharacterized protein LOC132062427 n=1 Tax=Lycium ferocissimum TaxID=112874 RepID=UPI002815CDD8|nr:uncharacterized protein LOC132062427 [Lycium ferocissimum]
MGCLTDIVSLNQAGFVKGRSIVENVLLTQEIVLDIRLRTKSANVVMKLDMAKAYDRVSWIFLMKVLRKIGFSELVIDMIFRLVSSNWGVKQGDPLSPTLFILTAEVMSTNLNALNLIRQFEGYGRPKWSPKVNHLSYVDDMIIFSSADVFSLQLIMEVLKKYENTSGQKINRDKSVVFMHKNVPGDVSITVEIVTGVIKQMHKMFAQFFWSNTIGGKSRHWASWNHLCLRVMEGGMGFGSLHDVSIALFCKLWWNFRTKPSLWSAFMVNKYCRKESPITVQKKQGSQTLKNMIQARNLIEHQIWWQLGMGNSQFWFDNWTGKGALYFTVEGFDESIQNVSDVVENGNRNMTKLNNLLPQDIVQHISATISPPRMDKEMDRAW